MVRVAEQHRAEQVCADTWRVQHGRQQSRHARGARKHSAPERVRVLVGRRGWGIGCGLSVNAEGFAGTTPGVVVGLGPQGCDRHVTATVSMVAAAAHDFFRVCCAVSQPPHAVPDRQPRPRASSSGSSASSARQRRQQQRRAPPSRRDALLLSPSKQQPTRGPGQALAAQAAHQHLPATAAAAAGGPLKAQPLPPPPVAPQAAAAAAVLRKGAARPAAGLLGASWRMPRQKTAAVMMRGYAACLLAGAGCWAALTGAGSSWTRSPRCVCKQLRVAVMVYGLSFSLACVGC